MPATINVICYRSKTLSNGEHPLMLRIIKDRRIKYQSLGISVKPEYWDFTKNKPKSNCPNKELINKIILEKEIEFQKKMLEIVAEGNEFTTSTLIVPKLKAKNVAEFYQEIIEELNLSGKIGNARVYKDSYNSLKSFTNNKLDIPFSRIDTNFLEKYEVWLRKKNLKETSMSLLFRTLRGVYNKGIKSKYAKKSLYPFEDFKISKFNIKTEKRAISKDLILQIMNLDLSGKNWYMSFSRDIFIFSYLCGGINFTDIASLKTTNIVENKLIYTRLKTRQRVVIPLSDKSLAIILKYESNSIYLFPILDGSHQTDIQIYNRKKKVLRKINSNLKKLSEGLTTYVARHSYATVLKNSGVNIALIGETLGHSDLKTTQIYLDSFENSQIDEALENLL